MAVPDHLKIVFRGVFADTPEEWSVSTKWDRHISGNLDPSTDDINAGQILTACDTFFGNARFHQGLKMTEWRAYLIGTDGLTQGNPRVELLDVADQVQGGSATYQPAQLSLCISLVANDRGPAKLGRLFLPAVAYPVASDLRISVANQTLMTTAVTQWLKDISNAIDVPTSLQSVSMVNISGVGGGKKQIVQQTRVGRVYDTQRRRRAALDEDYMLSGQIDW